MDVVVNGQKSHYAWDGEMSSAPRGYNVRADTDFNGRKAHLDLKNKSPEEIKLQMASYFAKLRSKKQLKRRFSRRSKKHLNKRSRR